MGSVDRVGAGYNNLDQFKLQDKCPEGTGEADNEAEACRLRAQSRWEDGGCESRGPSKRNRLVRGRGVEEGSERKGENGRN